MEMRTDKRCVILVKLPVALSDLMTLNSEPVAGEKASICPLQFRMAERIDRQRNRLAGPSCHKAAFP